MLNFQNVNLSNMGVNSCHVGDLHSLRALVLTRLGELSIQTLE